MIAVSLDDVLDELVERNRDAWLRDAETLLMSLDPRAYADGSTLHVIDFRAVGAPRRGFLGFAAGAQLHELARDLLPESAAPAAAVAVNVDRIARTLPADSLAARDDETIDRIRAAVAAVAAHELAHVLDDQALGGRLPPGATLEQVVRSLSDGRSTAPEHYRKAHSPGWVRAYLHLVFRAASVPHRKVWIERAAIDVAVAMPLAADAYLDALQDEILAHGIDDRLVDILRTPAPADFLSLFPKEA